MYEKKRKEKKRKDKEERKVGKVRC